MLDFEPEEQKRKQSLSLAVATFDHDEHRDHAHRHARLRRLRRRGGRGLRGGRWRADHDGRVGRRRGRHRAGGRAGPLARARAALFVITRCDRENADPIAALDALRAAFGNKIAPLHLAIGRAETFRGYVDLVHRKAYVWEGGKRSEQPRSRPSWPTRSPRRRDQLLEAAAEADDDVLTKYLEGEEITRRGARGLPPQGRARLDPGAGHGHVGRRTTSASRASSTRSSRYLPSPAEEPPIKATDGAGKEVEVAPDAERAALAQVFKTTADPFVGRLTYFRVFSGKIASHDHVWNADRGEEERIGQVLRVKGKDTEPVGVISAGEIGAVAKLVHTVHRRHAVRAREAVDPAADRLPASRRCRVAIEPQTKADLDKLGAALSRLLEEDPTRPRRAPAGDRRAAAVGAGREPGRGRHRAAQAQVRRGRRHAGRRASPIARRSAARRQAEGRHKKQTGGRGQFGHVWLEIEPNPGGGVEFADAGRRRHRAAPVLAGRREGRARRRREGPARRLPGHRLQGDPLRRLVPHGRLGRDVVPPGGPPGHAQGHPARRRRSCSSRSWTSRCACPRQYMGDVNRDLNTRRGRVLGMDQSDGVQVVRAHVPQAELFTYATELRSLTGGRGVVLRVTRPLRGDARARRAEGHRRAQEGRGCRRALVEPGRVGRSNVKPSPRLPFVPVVLPVHTSG